MEPTCVHCGSDKEPYFSRSEPMGFFCVDCGRNFDERDFAAELIAWENKWQCAAEMAAQAEAGLWETKQQLAAERALADRLAALVRRDRDRYGYGSATTNSVCGCSDCEYLRPLDVALAAWKEARSE